MACLHRPRPVLGPLGPTVTTALADGQNDVEVATELERLLSALTFLFDIPAEVGHYGGSWHEDAHAVPYSRGKQAPGWARKPPPTSLRLRRDSEGLQKALGWYREGRSSESPYYRFLAHWNALEAVFFGKDSELRRAQFIDRVAPHLAASWPPDIVPATKPSDHFRDVSRDAISHVVRRRKPMIDPDADTDRRRLDSESRFVQLLVPAAIRDVFGEPVEME